MTIGDSPRENLSQPNGYSQAPHPHSQLNQPQTLATVDGIVPPPSVSHGAPFPSGFDWAQTWADILRCAAQTSNGITHVLANGEERSQSYAALSTQAHRIATGLVASQLAPGTPVLLQIGDRPSFLAALWGCFLGSYVPVPLAIAPARTAEPGKPTALDSALKLLGKAAVLTSTTTLANVQPSTHSEAHRLILTLEHLPAAASTELAVPPGLDDLTLLLLTSGSTGQPKGVQLSRRNLLASTYGMATVNQLNAESVFLNWMPLEHVASLVMFHLTPVMLGCSQVQAANEWVLQDPLHWLDLLERHQATTTWAPNFAYGLICDALLERQKAEITNPPDTHPQPIRVHPRSSALNSFRGWDLSSIRWMGNGAEAVVGKTARRFLQLLAEYGLAADAVSPGYGMSETSSGIVHSRDFSLATTSDDDAGVALGHPIPGVSLRIVDENQQVVPEGTVGALQVQGLTVTVGYINRPDLNADVFTDDGWFNTGDLGFLQDGRLTLTGRQKDVIIINGANYHNHEIEAVVEELPEVEVAFTAACAVRRSQAETEQLAIFFHPIAGTEAVSAELLQAIRRRVVEAIALNPDYLIPVEKAAIPKTSIGKIQRSQLSQRFAAGEFDAVLQQVEQVWRDRPQPQALPQSEREQAIADIWQRVLGLTTIGLDETFFELGGTSLKLMQVLAQLSERFGTSLTTVDLFQHPTVRSLADFFHQKVLGQESPTAAAETDTIQTAQHRAQRRRPSTRSTDVAVVGMAGRFPGARNLQEFWQNLCDGVESVTFFSDEELLAAGVPPELISHPQYVKASPILDDVESFDAEFFGINPREAELLDPQQRLLLECAWESLENAGYDPLSYPGAIAIYAGASMNTYLLNQVYPNRDRLDPNESLDVLTLGSLGGFNLTVANDKDYLTTRVSYKLNLRGPSVNVQTACSTSLVAVHMACQSLLSGECDLALAGGVSVHTPQRAGHLFQEGMILTPDGHCRAFDAQARGTLFGSGVGLVVLKPLEAAIADQDTIYAVVKGAAMGNDGSQKVGYLAPRGEGQTQVAAEAIALADVDPETITYLEAHGTGTELGDPIEVAALTQAFRAATQKNQFCALGSVKTNVGHLNIASGIVGFLKTVLSLHHKTLPPSLHFDKPNPQIDFAQTPFFVNTETRDWDVSDHPRRAGVNSLGIGGTNVHVVLEEYSTQMNPDGHRWQEGRPEEEGKAALNRGLVDVPQVVTLSARSQAALEALVQRYATLLDENPELSLADVSFTAAVGRSHFAHRLAIVAESVADLQHQLQAALKEPTDAAALYQSYADDSAGAASQKVAFLFTGQGSQYPNMGRELLVFPAFRNALQQCADLLTPHLDIPLFDLLFPESESQNGQTSHKSKIHQTAYTQPALFALEYAVAQLWQSWGIKPAVVLGHSIGEYVAACLAGVFSLKDALKLVAARGRLIQALPKTGGMLAVMADEATIQPILETYQKQVFKETGAIAQHPTIDIAALNSPENTVLSGSNEVLKNLDTQLQAAGIKTTRLAVSHAFHSALMQPMVADFLEVAQTIDYHPPKLPLISNLTGDFVDEAIATPDYWCRHICQPVRFAQSLDTLHTTQPSILLECGPKPILLNLAAESSLLVQNPSPIHLPTLHAKRPTTFLHSLAKLYTQGYPIDWQSGFAGQGVGRIPLPTYPFQRQRYWLDAPKPRRSPSTANSSAIHPLLGTPLMLAVSDRLFQSELTIQEPTWLNDHQVFGQAVFPGAAYLEMAIAAGNALWANTPFSVRSLSLPQRLPLSETPTLLQTVVTPNETSTTLKILSHSATHPPIPSSTQPPQWLLHCTGELHQDTPALDPIDLHLWQQQCGEAVDVAAHYEVLRSHGLDYGQYFQGIQQLWRKDGAALGHIEIPATNQDYHIHPALLDACFQIILAALPEEAIAPYLPIGLEQLTQFRPVGDRVWSIIKLHPLKEGRKWVTADVHLLDETGNILVQVKGLTAQRTASAAASAIADWLYELQWHTTALPAKVPTPPSRHWLLVTPSAIDTFVHPIPQALKSHGHAVIQKAEVSAALPTGVQNVIFLADEELTATEQCHWLLRGVQSLVKQPQPPRVWLITQGVQPIGNGLTEMALEQAPLVGMIRAIALEHPELHCTHIDWDTRTPIETLLADLTSPTETQIAYRDGKRYVARLERSTIRHQLPSADTGQQLQIQQRGTLEALTWQSVSRTAPQPGEVEIRVRATGLNFRDVLNALGLYPGEAGALGLECAGEIVRAGEGVSAFQPGDAVVAIAAGSFGDYVTTDVRLVAPKPENISFAAAATIPVVFLTAYYMLCNVGGMKAGERVLIHAATGGVGLAAIQLAQQAGAEIFATASPGKWEVLKSRQISHIHNSRTLNFADEILAATNGEGMDLVLNSLNGDFIPKSLSVLKSKGRFLEIGKSGIWHSSQVAEVRPHATYAVVDLMELTQNQPDLIQVMLQALMPQFASGTLEPLPHEVFVKDEAIAAFRTMQQAKHIGKLVVTPSFSPRPDGAYLITGGLGALGRRLAEWVAQQGAKHLLLLGRSTPSNAAQATLAELKDKGITIEILQADVSDRPALANILAPYLHTDTTAPYPSLRGIFHAAGTLEDGALIHQTPEQCDRVLSPKVQGAWNLHQLTQNAQAPIDLDCFVLFSSAASLLGSAGQVNYAAANAYLDAIAHHRHSLGLPALSINWGAWDETGMAIDPTVRQNLTDRGITFLPPDAALERLDTLLVSSTPQVGVMAMDWEKWVRSGGSPSLVQDLLTQVRSITSSPAPTVRFLIETLEQNPVEQRPQILATYVKTQVARVLGTATDTLDLDQGLTELGLDSLTAVELRNRLQTDVGQPLPITLLFDYPTPADLTRYLTQRLCPEAEEPATEEATIAGDSASSSLLNSDVDELSEAEAEALLLAELDRLNQDKE
ncbi:MAG: SDR family NAD(P)-dependent oxidoreductase [Cyanobacteria bacterium J06638_20]